MRAAALDTVHPRARGEQSMARVYASTSSGSSPRTRGTATSRRTHTPQGRFIPAHAGNSVVLWCAMPPVSVHPRARGEQQGELAVFHRAGGSSPRTRGTVPVQQPANRGHRFIPAHAGNSLGGLGRNLPAAVHPRARGEQGKGGAELAPVGGSSPRTRGTDSPAHTAWRTRRFIPAHAGNSEAPIPANDANAVHPRARGEQSTAYTCGGLYRGSSPRTRGTVDGGHVGDGHSRFIPAHAGNSAAPAVLAGPRSVHPRARGEQRVLTSSSTQITGSSPRTRGTVSMNRVPGGTSRFIPAHAGNRRQQRTLPAKAPVHPRARGEQCGHLHELVQEHGSSPRTRGTAAGEFNLHDSVRFIPAHAGNSRSPLKRRAPGTVHPRARGEQARVIKPGHNVSGSSPRTRGTAHDARAGRVAARFIPAHAGNRRGHAASTGRVAVHPRARGEQQAAPASPVGVNGSSPRTRGTDFI